MTKLIYGTNNPAKLQSMRDCLAPLEIEVIGLRETGVDISDVAENGNTPLDNARIKALAYYTALNRPVFACDSGLYIDGLTDEEQPGVHVRMVNGKRMNDDEMVAHYAAIAGKLGGRAVARYKNAICFVINENEVYEHFGDDISGDTFCFVNKPHPKRIEGFPLDCLSVHIDSGEYYYWHRPDGDVGMMNKGFQRFFRKVLAQKNVNICKYHPDDCEQVWNLFYNTIHSINAADYTESQLDAWASKEMDLHTWNERLLKNDYAVVAELNDVIVGIGTADDAGYFDFLYVHKDYQRMGIATLIADKIEEYLRSKGVQAISTDVSITAKPFFEKRGYIAKQEQYVECRGQHLTNYKMMKQCSNDKNEVNAIPEIRLLTTEHLPQYADVIRRSFATVAQEFGWTRENCPGHTSFITDERLASKLKNGYFSFGYCVGETLFGFMSLTDMGDSVYEMNDVSILPEWRHYGYGKRMIDFCKEKVKELGGNKITIGIVEENTILKDWYVANGFIHTGTKQFEHLPFTVGYMECSV